jgi:hypothetical protein
MNYYFEWVGTEMMDELFVSDSRIRPQFSSNILQLHGVYYLCKTERHNGCRIATLTYFNINLKPK